MHLELGHQAYEPTESVHPAVASVVRPPGPRSANIKRSRSASNPARSIERYASHFPSGEKRGVLSAPRLVVIGRSVAPSGPTRYRSTLVLSATTESPCIATTID